MGSSVYSSFLLSNLFSGRMTLKTMVLLCLGLVVFTEAYPAVCDVEQCYDSAERKKRSPELTEDDNVTSDGSTDGALDVLAGNAMNDAVDTIIKSNESGDNTDDSEQEDDMSTGGYGGGRKKREEEELDECYNVENPGCDG